MIDPWRFVDADDDLVADFLAGTIEAVLELGAYLHPEVRFIARDGQIGVNCSAPADTPLLQLPATGFVRITRVNWTDSRDALEVDGLLAELTPAESELLVLQVAMHNGCGKVPWLASSHPLLADDLSDEAIDAVRAFVPDFRVTPMSAASVFWSNRVFRIPTLHSAEPEPVAMPLVDLLNHDTAGTRGTWTGDAFVITAAVRPGTDECVLDYGYDRDAITMAATYGFVDTSSVVATGPGADLASVDRLIAATAGSASTAAATLHAAAERQRRLIVGR